VVAASLAVLIVSDILIVFNQSIFFFKLQSYLLPNMAETPDFTQKTMPKSFTTEILQKIENKSKQCENSCI